MADRAEVERLLFDSVEIADTVETEIQSAPGVLFLYGAIRIQDLIPPQTVTPQFRVFYPVKSASVSYGTFPVIVANGVYPFYIGTGIDNPTPDLYHVVKLGLPLSFLFRLLLFNDTPVTVSMGIQLK